MINSSTHPGRSPEFLSRLHDGDVTAAERAQFESHRAHCAPCRQAASDFEAALALFRSTRPGAPRPDLSERVLRKLRASNSRPARFGPTFGIDLRWAGAFAAALIAVLIGSSIAVRREAAERRVAASGGPIPVTLDHSRSSPDSAPALSDKRDARRGQAPMEKRSRQSASRENAPAAPQQAPAAQAGAGGRLDARNEVAEKDKTLSRLEVAPPAPAAAPPPAAPRVSTAPSAAFRQEPSKPLSSAEERPGGEGAAAANSAADSLAARPRLEVFSLDSAGPPPALVAESAAEIDLPEELRGREFTLLVEAGGRVREVRPTSGGTFGDLKKERQKAQVESKDQESRSLAVLKSLRFQPGDGPRVVGLRVR